VGASRRRLHLNAHMDTVVAVDGWKTDPWTPTVVGDELFGLGASDCKGGVAALLWLAPRVRPKVRVLFSFTACEEGIGRAKANGARKIAAMGGDWAITAEPSCSGEGVELSLGTQGHARAVVRFAGRAAHSSRPDLGENAICAAARFCLAVEKLDASYREIPVHGGAVARPSAAATLIRGGTLSNIIPDGCEVTVSRRLAPGETNETLRGELAGLLAGARATHEVFESDLAACTDLKGPLFAAARGALIEVTGRERYRFQRGRTDAVIFAARGMDTLTVGPGQVTACHVANESVNLRAAAECVRVMERLVNGLPG
jgi:succinyl-diaminopimelate desuccinylase